MAKKIAFHEYGVYTKNLDVGEWKENRVYPRGARPEPCVRIKT